jgi:hypothetical protein
MGQLEPVTCLTVHSQPRFAAEASWLQVYLGEFVAELGPLYGSERWQRGAYPWDSFAGACHLRSIAAQLLLEQTFGARPDRSGTI